MKKMPFFTLAAIGSLSLLSLASCQQKAEPYKEHPSSTTLQLNLTSPEMALTKSTVAPTEAGDQTIKRLDIFVFNDDGKLDIHHIEDQATIPLTGIQINVKTGDKTIWVVANAFNTDKTTNYSWTGVTSLEELQEKTYLLKDEVLDNYTMVGSTNVTIDESHTTASVNITRLISRVELASLKTDFAETPYEGMTLTEVKAYLINVVGGIHLSGANALPYTILNNTQYVAADNTSLKIANGLYDVIGNLAAGATHNTSHYFYAYKSPTTKGQTLVTEGGQTIYNTLLVIEAKFPADPTPYYYPIYVAANANTSYKYNITIKRPGSLTPNDPISFQDASFSVTVTPWNTTTEQNITF